MTSAEPARTRRLRDGVTVREYPLENGGRLLQAIVPAWEIHRLVLERRAPVGRAPH